jgi:two-component sensor histidine kinase
MIRNDAISTAVFAITVFGAAAAFSIHDRNVTLTSANERFFSVSRLMAAHAEAAISDAASRVDEISPLVAEWDMVEGALAEQIYARLATVSFSPSIGGMAVIDSAGVSVLTSFSYPSPIVDVSSRPHIAAHLAGEAGPIIKSDDVPGPISGEQYFSYSQALYDETGNLHAIIVAIIFNRIFEELYTDVATWPQARGTLYDTHGEILAGMQNEPPASEEFVTALFERIGENESGSIIMDEGATERLVAWHTVDGPVQVIAVASQEIKAALADWRTQTLMLALFAIALVASFCTLMLALRRARMAADSAEFYRTAVAEVHHRVKNALQLSISMLNIRSRALGDADQKELLTKVAGQLTAIAEIQDLLQHDTSLHEVDLCDLMDRLCIHLRKAGTGRTIAFKTEADYCRMETNRATYAAIIVNELLTNALKHARRNIVLTLDCSPTLVTATVSDDGQGLPEGFLADGQDGFGLRAIALIADRIGGTISMENGKGAGLVARFQLPMEG